MEKRKFCNIRTLKNIAALTFLFLGANIAILQQEKFAVAAKNGLITAIVLVIHMLQLL